MKNARLVLLFLVLSFSSVFAQSASQRIKELVKEKEYEQAVVLVPQAVAENPKDIGTLVTGGDIYLELEKLDSALMLFKRADDLDGGEAYILRRIGNTMSLMGRHAEAIDYLKSAAKESKGDVLDELALGNAYIRADSLRQAQLIITRAKEKNKNLAEPLLTLGDLYYAQKVYDLARQHYEDALKINENLTDARIKLATSYYILANKESDHALSQEYFNLSLKEWNTVTAKDPKNARAWFEQGKIFFLASQYLEAAQSFNQFIQLRPTGSLGRWYLAQSLVEIGKCDEAVTHLDIVSKEIDSVKNKAALKLASCLYEQKRYPESISTYQNLKNANLLTDVKDIERYASALFKSGDTLQAITVYKEVIEKDPSRCELAYQIGMLMLYMKNYNDASFFYNRFLNSCPQDSLAGKATYYLGISHSQAGRHDSAYVYFKKLIQQDPNNLMARVYLGDVYAAMKKIDSAKAEFKDVIAIGMKDPKTYEKELAQAFNKYSGQLLEEKSYAELLKYSKMWTEVDSKSQSAWLYNAIGNQASNDTENACKSYRKVLQIDPKNQIAAKYLKQLNCP